jgi:hypothetical protein
MSTRELIVQTVRRASMLGLGPEERAKAQKVSQRADSLGSTLRGLRAEYERYLYQALGRKVDFEEVDVSKSSSAHYTVTVRYIVLRANSEPMAPRLWATFTVAPSAHDVDGVIRIDVNAGFTNGIGMSHSKFTQESWEDSMLSDASKTFGWIEYLDGDFLGGNRLVRPFTPHAPDMGTLTAGMAKRACSGSDMRLVGEVVQMSRMVAQKRGFPAGALSLFHTGYMSVLLNYLDSMHFYDEGTLVREAMVFAAQDTRKRAHVPYPQMMPALTRLFQLSVALDVRLAEDLVTHEAFVAVLEQVAELLVALGEETPAAKVSRAAAMLAAE